MEHAEDRMDAMNLFPNPENPLEIKIPLFEGPLDLLLHLIRKKEVSIAEVKLSELTSSYLSYIELMQSVNLDIAGEFLEIAATLILIKSRHLLPKPIEEMEDEDEETPDAGGADPEGCACCGLPFPDRYKRKLKVPLPPSAAHPNGTRVCDK